MRTSGQKAGRRVALALAALVIAFGCASLSPCLHAFGGAGEPESPAARFGVQSLTPADPGLPGDGSRAYLAWFNPSTEAFEPLEAGQMVVAGNTARFDVLIERADGTVQTAAEANEEVSWKLANDTWGGEMRASIDDGTVTLAGQASKAVLVNVECGRYEVEGAPTFACLFAGPAEPGDQVAIGDLSVSWPSASGRETLASGRPRRVAAPLVGASSGSLEAEASVSYLASRTGQAGPASGDDAAGLSWRVGAFYDPAGARVDSLLADVSARGRDVRLSAAGAGDGWAVLRCDSLAFPEFGGLEVPVRITGIGGGPPASRMVESAQLVYRGSDGLYRSYSGYTLATSPLAITEPFGSVSLDVRLTFADGSTARASERGMAVDWTVRGADAKARISADGTLRATHSGNGRARIAGAAVNGKQAAGVPAYVSISGNDAGVAPSGDSLAVSARSNYWMPEAGNPADSDGWFWRSAPGSGGPGHEMPLVVGSATSGTSTCTLSAAIAWSDGAVTTSAEADGGVRSWSVLGCVDQNGNVCDDLVAVDSEGAVTSTEVGSGFATVLCTTVVDVFDAQGVKSTMRLSGSIVVGVFQPTSNVSRMVLLDKAGEELKASSFVIPNGDSVYQFYVRVFFRDGSTSSNYPEAGDFGAEATSGVKWAVYRNENRADVERYSSVSAGKFHAETGFARGYVSAVLEGASFSGKDVECGITVIAEGSIEEIGRSDSMTVKIYHYSDYANHGDDAPVAKEVTVTRTQLEPLATYSTWYTFLRRNGKSFATVYARGVAMENLLALCGVDSDRLVSVLFTGADGYAPERHSAQFILGTQFRYTNYYYHLSLPGLMRAQSVAPMLALEYYMKSNGGYEDATDRDDAGAAGYGFMSPDSTLRVIFGMMGPETPNGRLSITRVNAMAMVVDDNTFAPEQPEEDDEPQQPEDAEKPDEPDRKDEREDDEKDLPKPDDPLAPEPEESGEGDHEKREDPVGGQRHGAQNNERSSGEKAEAGDDERGGNNPYQGGKRDEGVGTDLKHGSQVALSPENLVPIDVGYEDASNDVVDTAGAKHGALLEDGSQGQVEYSGEKVLREMSESPEAGERMVIPAAEIGAGYWIATGLSCGLALSLGMGGALARFRRDDLDGRQLAGKGAHGERKGE